MVVKQFDLARIDLAVTDTTATETSALLPEPGVSEIRLEAVLQALGDPVRLLIVRQLHTSENARTCGSFELPVGKSTASHHFKVLRESGVIRQRVHGRNRETELRQADLDERFPGLLGSVLNASD
jgi:DNA-binding transcriptional ArsR family regulator